MALADRMRELLAAALAAPDGRAQLRLARGAQLTLRARGRRRQLIIARHGAPVGEAEETVFRRDGRVPEGAARETYTRTGGYHLVALTWEEPAGLFDEEVPDA